MILMMCILSADEGHSDTAGPAARPPAPCWKLQRAVVHRRGGWRQAIMETDGRVNMLFYVWEFYFGIFKLYCPVLIFIYVCSFRLQKNSLLWTTRKQRKGRTSSSSRSLSKTWFMWVLSCVVQVKTGSAPVIYLSIGAGSSEPETCLQIQIHPELGAAEMADRMAFMSLLEGLLHLDGDKRISPRQALEQPFISMSHLREDVHRD